MSEGAAHSIGKRLNSEPLSYFCTMTVLASDAILDLDRVMLLYCLKHKNKTCPSKGYSDCFRKTLLL